MARYAMQRFVYEGDWHLRHLFHLCRPCHHDIEGGGRGGEGGGKCAAARAVTWVSSLELQKTATVGWSHPKSHAAVSCYQSLLLVPPHSTTVGVSPLSALH